MSKASFYVARHEYVYDEARDVVAPVCYACHTEGDLDKNDEFGFTADRRGGYRWVHIRSGEYSRRSYGTLGGCKTAVKRMRNEILFGRRGIYKARWYKPRVRMFHAAIAKIDAAFFERLGVEPEHKEAAEPAAPQGGIYHADDRQHRQQQIELRDIGRYEPQRA